MDNIYSTKWEYEDDLPEMSDVEYAHLFPKSELRKGVRMFPYIRIWNESGVFMKCYIGV